MSIQQDAAVFEAQIFPQGDIRDPLGVWGVRQGITGDASGGTIKVNFQVSSPRRAAFVYTAYSLNYGQLTGSITATEIQVRLLTGWPNIDAQEGVQAYGSNLITAPVGAGSLTAPVTGAGIPLVGPNDRFLLLFDPRAQGQDLDIVEMEINTNVDLATFTFEGYGYYWDRSVLGAPGGPRHPGSA